MIILGYNNCLEIIYQSCKNEFSFGVRKDILVEKLIYYFDDISVGEMEFEEQEVLKDSRDKANGVIRDLIMAGFKTMVGGELIGYTEMMNEARAIATKRMVADAERLGADGIVNIRYASSAIMQGAAEVIAYGTAVKFK